MSFNSLDRFTIANFCQNLIDRGQDGSNQSSQEDIIPTFMTFGDSANDEFIVCDIDHGIDGNGLDEHLFWIPNRVLDILT
jgi:hypothetical protein